MSELLGGALVLLFGWALGGPGGLSLAALGLALAWAASRLWWPYKPCRRCGATGRNPGSNDRRHGDCRRCHGARRVRRFGAGYVHRLKLAIIGRIRDR